MICNLIANILLSASHTGLPTDQHDNHLILLTFASSLISFYVPQTINQPCSSLTLKHTIRRPNPPLIPWGDLHRREVYVLSLDINEAFTSTAIFDKLPPTIIPKDDDSFSTSINQPLSYRACIPRGFCTYPKLRILVEAPRKLRIPSWQHLR